MEICWLCFQFTREEDVINNVDVENVLNNLQDIIPFKVNRYLFTLLITLWKDLFIFRIKGYIRLQLYVKVVLAVFKQLET